MLRAAGQEPDFQVSLAVTHYLDTYNVSLRIGAFIAISTLRCAMLC
jgi:hypothetical protein